MNKQGILHPELASWAAMLGHHDYLLLTDAGYLYLRDSPRIDLGFARGRPSFLSVAEVLVAALPIEKMWKARELPAQNPGVSEGFKKLATQSSFDFMKSHNLFKERAPGDGYGPHGRMYAICQLPDRVRRRISIERDFRSSRTK